MKLRANILDVLKKDIYPAELTIKEGIFKEVKPITEEEYSLDVNGIIIPGFIDAHIHIESTMLTPSQFARAAVRFGVTAVICDPHEIANVSGKEGVKFMMEDGEAVPFDFHFAIPSCVPATPFETSGAILTSDDIEELIQMDNVVALAEMMNVPGVLTGDEEVLRKCEIARKYNKVIDGHAPLLSGDDLKSYLNQGIVSDHECSTYEEIFEKSEEGMKIFLRDGSSVSNLDYILDLNNLLEYFSSSDEVTAEEIRKILSLDIFTAIISDDKHADHILEGYLKNSFLKLIDNGFDLFSAIQMVTSRPAQHYGLNEGVIAKDNKANFFIVDSLRDFNVKSTFVGGECVFDGENVLFEARDVEAKNTINCDLKVASDFEIYSDEDEVKVNVIRAIENSLITEKEVATLKTENGVIKPNIKKDVLKIAVVERYGGNTIANGFVSGFSLDKGAIASSVAHDSHNIVVVGTNSEDMAKVTNIVCKNQGGLAICCDEFENSLPLPVAGLMSNEPVEKVAKKMDELRVDVEKLNTSLSEPFMILSFLALLVIPHIKLSDKGLFDGDAFEFIDVIIK